MQIFFVDIKNLTEFDLSQEILCDCLDQRELKRLYNTKQNKSRLQFIIGRILLKSVLCERLYCKPKDIQMNINEKGRPELTFNQDVQFNLTHSKDIVLVAVGNSKLGVDVEYMKERNYLEIAKHFFSQEEYAQLKENTCDLSVMFYSLWTLKEAYVKYLGQSLFDRKIQIRFQMRSKHKLFPQNTNANVDFWTYALNDEYVFSVLTEQADWKNEKETLQIFKMNCVINNSSQQKLFWEKEEYLNASLLYTRSD